MVSSPRGRNEDECSALLQSFHYRQALELRFAGEGRDQEESGEYSAAHPYDPSNDVNQTKNEELGAHRLPPKKWMSR